jgi:hypothetical protein
MLALPLGAESVRHVLAHDGGLAEANCKIRLYSEAGTITGGDWTGNHYGFASYIQRLR